LDNVTHTLFGATLARTPLARAGRGTTAALLLASNAPDIDIVAALGGGSIKYLEWHRGPTHGPLGVVVLAVVTAAIVSVGRRFYDRRANRRRAATRDWKRRSATPRSRCSSRCRQSASSSTS